MGMIRRGGSFLPRVEPPRRGGRARTGGNVKVDGRWKLGEGRRMNRRGERVQVRTEECLVQFLRQKKKKTLITYGSTHWDEILILLYYTNYFFSES